MCVCVCVCACVCACARVRVRARATPLVPPSAPGYTEALGPRRLQTPAARRSEKIGGCTSFVVKNYLLSLHGAAPTSGVLAMPLPCLPFTGRWGEEVF